MSAAGLQTSTDLEDALFAASLGPIGNSIVGETGAVIGKALLRVIKVDPGDIKLKADMAPGKSVVCIDDVERFAGDFSVLFGFIVNLLDETGIHCVLIADENRAVANLDGYATYKERIVGKTVLVSPTVRDFCEEVINGFANQQSREALGPGLEELVALIANAKLSNLRTVRLFLTELDAVIREMPREAANRVMASALPSAMLFWSASIARSSDNLILVERAFQGDVGMAIAMARVNRTETKQRDSNDAPDDLERLAALLSELGLENDSYGWPESRALVSLAKGGAFDLNDLVREFSLHEAGDVEIDDLEILRHHYKNGDSEVHDAIARLRAAAIDGKPPILMRLFHVFRMIHYLAENYITTFTPEEWTQEVLATLEKWRQNPENVQCGQLEIWPEKHGDNELLVVNALEQVSESVKRLDERRVRKAAVHSLLTGEGHSLQDHLQVVFADEVDAEWFLEQLKAAGSPAIQRVHSLFRSHLRISNAVQFVAIEARFARQLSELITTKIELRRPMLILDSELRMLADLLRTFAEKMDKDSE